MRFTCRMLVPVILIALSVISVNAESNIKMTLDPRIELIAVIQVLVKNYPVVTRQDTEYKREVLTYFSPYENHRAVTLFKEMWPKGFNFGTPPAMMLYLSDPPELKVRLTMPDEIVLRAGGKERLDEFIQALRDFSQAAKFMSFFKNQKNTHQQILSNGQQKIKGIDIRVAEDYYGMKKHSYTIIFSPLLHDGGYGPRVPRKDGTDDVYSIIGPKKAENGLPYFGDEDSFRDLIWHEFSHSFANPIVESFREQVAKYSSLATPIQAEMKKQGYGSWESIVNEHIVRAVTVRLHYRVLGKEAGDKALEQQKRRSFSYAPALCDALQRYESNRKEFPTLAVFFPELLKTFEEIAKEAKQ